MKYLSGTLDLGALGKIRLVAFKNDKKQGNQPDWKVYVGSGNDMKEVGALWENEKKEPVEAEVKFNGEKRKILVEAEGGEPAIVEEQVVRG